MRSIPFLFLLLTFSLNACGQKSTTTTTNKEKTDTMGEFEIKKSDAEWKAQLTDDQYQVLRLKGTEKPFSGKYYYENEEGVYCCSACNNPLFKSDTKFDAGCGWPSFYEPITKDAVKENKDVSHGMVRTEVVCGKCGGHLGHVFNDAPDQPGGLRYCINSVSIDLEEEKK
jgi:peptide-methionine (R)-S-oxide reductase